MRGTSSTSLREVSQRAQEHFRAAETDLPRTATDLFEVADAIDSSNQLVRALSDAGRPAEVKDAVVRSLFAGRVDAPVLELTLEVVRRRWSGQEDILDAIEQLGVDALLEQAQRDDVLGQVEEELFQASRAIDDSADLSGALDGLRDAPRARGDLVERLLEGHVHPLTVRLARRAVARPSDLKPSRRVLGFAEFASERRRRLLAVVTSARPLSAQQQTRIAAILHRLYGREVQINLDQDEDVVGGLRIQVGDDLFDATVLARLSEARTRLVA